MGVMREGKDNQLNVQGKGMTIVADSTTFRNSSGSLPWP